MPFSQLFDCLSNSWLNGIALVTPSIMLFTLGISLIRPKKPVLWTFSSTYL
jgi:hypothetical protein